jgi:hypothetical protein
MYAKVNSFESRRKVFIFCFCSVSVSVSVSITLHFLFCNVSCNVSFFCLKRFTLSETLSDLYCLDSHFVIVIGDIDEMIPMVSNSSTALFTLFSGSRNLHAISETVILISPSASRSRHKSNKKVKILYEKSEIFDIFSSSSMSVYSLTHSIISPHLPGVLRLKSGRAGGVQPFR